MERIFLGIPVLNRLDLMEKAVACIDVPTELLIVNNSRSLAFLAGLQSLTNPHCTIEIKTMGHNLGVAASWNLIVRTGISRRHEYIYISSNDTNYPPGILEKIIAFDKQGDMCCVWMAHGFNFFCLHSGFVEKVGWFDENFYPAYYEDHDFAYRCQLAGVSLMNVPGLSGINHEGSQTIKSDPAYAARNQRTQGPWNLNHYRMKWGGNPGEEIFKTPYNRSDNDYHWWPDVGGSVAARDWDNEEWHL